MQFSNLVEDEIRYFSRNDNPQPAVTVRCSPVNSHLHAPPNQQLKQRPAGKTIRGMVLALKSEPYSFEPMKRNLQILAMPAAIAATFLIGCASQERITDRADPTRASLVQTQEGYDTFGRKWGVDAPPSAPAAVAQPKMLTRNDYVLLSFTGTISDIDYANREMTLTDSQGRSETFAVDKDVKRFNEAKVGDKVSLDYYLGMNAQIRKPTAEEAQNPLVVTAISGRAAPDVPAAAHSVQQVRALVTIEAMDRAKQTVTVKGPRGKYYVARVADPSRFDKVHIGDTIVLTFTEAAVVSLNPAGS